MRGSREISLVPSLHRASTDALINPTGRADFPSFFPFYLSSSPSDLHTPPFFQSTRREIGSETTDNLSEDNPVKNAYRASAHALILTHPYIFVDSHIATNTLHLPALKLYTVLYANSIHHRKQNKDVGMGL